MADFENGAYFSTVLDYLRSRQFCRYLFQPNPPTPITDWPPFFPNDESIGLDESLTTGIVLAYPTFGGATDTVTFAHQNMPVTAWAKKHQTLLLSGGGKHSIYDSTHKGRIIEVKLKNITMTKLHRLYIFLMNIIEMALKTFEYIDESGTLYKVRFLDKKVIRNTHHVGESLFLSDIILHFWVNSFIVDYTSGGSAEEE